MSTSHSQQIKAKATADRMMVIDRCYLDISEAKIDRMNEDGNQCRRMHRTRANVSKQREEENPRNL